MPQKIYTLVSGLAVLAAIAAVAVVVGIIFYAKV